MLVLSRIKYYNKIIIRSYLPYIFLIGMNQMLAENELRNELSSGRIFRLTNANLSSFKVQPSSIDLTIKLIHIPEDDKTKKCHSIAPGETIILEINEIFSLSNDISGIVFPKNTLSKNGIIMTNPGHVDPGYNGILTLYLVNMSKETYKLRAQDAVARLLLFKTSSITSGYQGSSVTQVDEEQLSSMGKDFAGLNTRMTSALRKVLAEWSVVLFVIIGIMISIIGFAVPIAFTMTTSHFDNTQELKQSIKNQEEKIENLNKQITLLNSLEPKHSDIIQKRTAK